ncbi:MAG: hypothetical protein HYR63_18975 [Proteobacteria bacterium]|nr:hypothetical protein [Pseudomonadota bacterium]MBI3496144.1 hypothetical protein [Pseudomonadota bacterium]
MPTIPSATLLPFAVPGQSVALRPDVTRENDAARLRGRDPRVAAFSERLQRSRIDPGAGDGSGADTRLGSPDLASERRSRSQASDDNSGGASAPFLAQAIGQELGQTEEMPVDPFGQATAAYGRLQAKPGSLVIDFPARVDISV